MENNKESDIVFKKDSTDSLALPSTLSQSNIACAEKPAKRTAAQAELDQSYTFYTESESIAYTNR